MAAHFSRSSCWHSTFNRRQLESLHLPAVQNPEGTSRQSPDLYMPGNRTGQESEIKSYTLAPHHSLVIL